MQSKQSEIVGVAYEPLKDHVKKYAQEDASVLFIGETGCGKELFGNFYMSSSNRNGIRKIINCGEYTDNLLRSEVFGHVKGAFTDAKTDRNGYLKTCNGGILFLDELGDASPGFQATILRVSEGHPFHPVGSDKEERTNTLIIAATNKPAQIREELKRRFKILPIPPLQKFDIPRLAEYFLGKMPKAEVLKELMACDYPGNVRELKHHCEDLLVERGSTILTERAPGITTEVGTFDYERFKDEFLIWDKYISPILLKHDLNYRYKYFPISTSSPPVEDKSPRFQTIRQRIELKRNPNLRAPDPVIEESELVKNLLIGKGDKERIEEFMRVLDNYFRQGDLGTFLRGIDKYIGHNDEFKKWKPDLSPLLDLNWDEAVKRFKVEYLNYYLQNHNGDRGETAKRIGMKKNTLDTTLLRLRSTSKTTSGTKA
jgi:DNA-binding NtrC family response regulator